MRRAHDQFTVAVFALADYAERCDARAKERAEQRRRKRALMRWFDGSAERSNPPGPGFGSWL